MRLSAYHLFEIVAWPAAVWCTLEATLRFASGEVEGLATTAATAALAGLTVAACRIRSRQLVPAPVATRPR
jgi:hypothetical protein